jgi:hypothetical protein
MQQPIYDVGKALGSNRPAIIREGLLRFSSGFAIRKLLQ